jgi:5-methylcytosine-specific restriction endonuclease McrA
MSIAHSDYQRKPGDEVECAVCKGAFIIDCVYHIDFGVCYGCVREIAYAHHEQHSGEPHPFLSAEKGWQQPKSPASKRKPLSPTTVLRIWNRDGRECVTCQSAVDLTIDHIVPVSLGGPNSDNNLQTMCRSCNSRKGARI